MRRLQTKRRGSDPGFRACPCKTYSTTDRRSLACSTYQRTLGQRTLVRCKGFSRLPNLESCASTFGTCTTSSSSSDGRLPRSVVSLFWMTIVACFATFTGVFGALSWGVGIPGMRMGEGDADDGIRFSCSRDGIEMLSPSCSYCAD